MHTHSQNGGVGWGRRQEEEGEKFKMKLIT